MEGQDVYLASGCRTLTAGIGTLVNRLRDSRGVFALTG